MYHSRNIRDAINTFLTAHFILCIWFDLKEPTEPLAFALKLQKYYSTTMFSKPIKGHLNKGKEYRSEIWWANKGKLLLHRVNRRPQRISLKYHQPYFPWVWAFVSIPLARRSCSSISFCFMSKYKVLIWCFLLSSLEGFPLLETGCTKENVHVSNWALIKLNHIDRRKGKINTGLTNQNQFHKS